MAKHAKTKEKKKEMQIKPYKPKKRTRKYKLPKDVSQAIRKKLFRNIAGACRSNLIFYYTKFSL